MVPSRMGHGRLIRDLLRNFLRELLKEKFTREDAGNAVKLAEQITTSAETAEWLRNQGVVAADAAMSPQDKTAAISAGLVGKLAELGLMEPFDEAVFTQYTRVLIQVFKVVMEPDADVLHEGLRDRVLDYVRASLEIGATQDDLVAEVIAGISKTLTLLRFEEISEDDAMSLLISDISWLACAVGIARSTLRGKLLMIDKRLWELLEPYIYTEEAPTAKPATPR